MPRARAISLIRRHGQVIALLAACIASNAPLWFFDPGMDVLTHLVSMSCFSEQFWQGNLYPRWCFSANFSFGSPHLLIYYPLSYFVSALFYPLHTLLGVSLKHIFILGLLPPTLFTAFGVRLWLKPVAGGAQATLAACLLLFLPYRLELMYTRCAISELWCMAIAPFAFHFTRALAQEKSRAVWPLGVAVALLLLANVPAALGVLLACGFTMLFYVRRQPVLLLRFGLALLGGIVLASPYWLPALAYGRLLNHASGAQVVNVNSYVTDLMIGPYPGVLFGSVALTMTAFLICGGALLRRVHAVPARERAPYAEALQWLAIGCVLAVSLFPVSAPFWTLINRAAVVGFPWRMQLALSFSIIFLFAVNFKLKRGDVAALFGLLFLLPPMFLVQFGSGQQQKLDEVLESHAIISDHYRPVFVQPDFYNWYWYQKVAQAHPFPAEVVSGQCALAVDQWGWREIVLKASSRHGCTVRLHHLYFPLWRLAPSPDSKGFSFKAEDDTGLMRLTIPGGHYRIVIAPVSTLQMMWEAL